MQSLSSFEEKNSFYILRVDLPGLDKDKINITVRGTLLTVQGVRASESESQDDEQGFYAKESSYGSFSRTLTLPGPVAEGRIDAKYENGVLTITLPKVEGGKTTKRVPVQ